MLIYLVSDLVYQKPVAEMFPSVDATMEAPLNALYSGDSNKLTELKSSLVILFF
jgi:hypothetical protein